MGPASEHQLPLHSWGRRTRKAQPGPPRTQRGQFTENSAAEIDIGLEGKIGLGKRLGIYCRAAGLPFSIASREDNKCLYPVEAKTMLLHSMIRIRLHQHC